MPKYKKLLTLDQLVQFCEQNKFYTFSSKDTGYTLSVQVPGYFDTEVNSTQGLLFTKLRVCHTELNRNKSYISEENMKKAMPSLKYRPVLAKIHQLDDGTWDFHSHDMNFIENENGEIEVEYEEQQIGTFTADEPYLEYNEDHDKTYVMANAVIPEEYTKAADIIREKNGTKVSCEICIDTMSYNAKEKYLELEDFYFSGCTCLGAEKDGTQIGEGMEGSRLDIADFSTENNGVFKEDYQSRMIEALDKLNIALSNFNIKGLQEPNLSFKEGGNEVLNKFKELLEKYSKTEEDITFEIEGLSDDELEAKFEEVFGKDIFDDGDPTEGEPTDENSGDGTTSEEGGSGSDDNDDDTTDDDKADDATVTEDEACSKKKKKKCSVDENGDMNVSFELSHDDIRYALYNLVEQYDELDNDYYWIRSVYDDHFVMEGWCTGSIYGCKYTKDGDNVSLDGERYRLYEELLTESEKAELDSMRSNYAELKQFKLDTENAELHSQREAILVDEKYSVLAENETFAKLKSEMDNYSLADLEKEAKVILADHLTNGGTFAMNETKKPVAKKQFSNPDKKNKPSRYGSLFSK